MQVRNSCQFGALNGNTKHFLIVKYFFCYGGNARIFLFFFILILKK